MTSQQAEIEQLKKEVREHVARLNFVSCKSSQLTALLAVISGGGFKNFQNLSDKIQDNLLWLASDLSFEIDKVAGGEMLPPE